MTRKHTSAATLLFLLALAGTVGAQADGTSANQLTPAERAAGWTLLFDGHSAEHWRGFKRKDFPTSGWSVEDGTMKVDSSGTGGDIITRDTFENFELIVEFKVSEQANSGILYGVQETGEAVWHSGPEYQILDDEGYGLEPSDLHAAGSLYDLAPASPDKQLKPRGEWNVARIRMKDGHVQHFLNGELLLEDDFNSADFKERVKNSKFNKYPGFADVTPGHIALQDHGHDVWFRNIKIRDLDAELPDQITLFDGTNLNGWLGYFKDNGRMPDVFTVEDGILIDKGSPIGYIRTEDTYTNFVLKLEWRWNPKTMDVGNGGVLIRMIGEDKVWPKSIEAQLHSGNAGDIWNIDKFDMTVDSSRTSGRRTQKLRFAENPVGQWNEYEIICDGSDVTLRINGYLVNKAWDVAEVPGHICLQSEGAEMHFRNIRLAPIR